MTNKRAPKVIKQLTRLGYNVYDFYNPETAFLWETLIEDWTRIKPKQYTEMLNLHGKLHDTFRADMKGLETADAVILVLPCGKSAHLELGYAVADNKKTLILLDDKFPNQPELMYKMVDIICYTTVCMLSWLKEQ